MANTVMMASAVCSAKCLTVPFSEVLMGLPALFFDQGLKLCGQKGQVGRQQLLQVDESQVAEAGDTASLQVSVSNFSAK